MSNNYVPDLPALNPGETARSADVNDRYTNTVAGFDKLPAPAVGKQGFSDPVPVGTPTDTDHAVTKDYLENTWITPTMKTQLESLILANLNTVATNVADVNTVAADQTDIGTVSTNIASVNTVSTNIASVNTVSTNIASVNDVSTNMASVLQVLTDADNFSDQYLGPKTGDPALDNDGDPLVAGALYFNTAAGSMRVYNGSTWIDVVSAAVLNKFSYTATGGQTVFTGADENAQTLSIVEGNELVFVNGVLMEYITDYTRTGSAITLTTGAALNDEVNIIALGVADIADVVPASSGGTFNGQITVTGDLTVDTDTLYVDSTNNRVGIGTATPSFDLSVVSAESVAIAVGEDATYAKYMALGTDIDGGVLTAGSATTGTNDLKLRTSSSGTENEVLRLTSTRRAGINTTSWAGSLDDFRLTAVGSTTITSAITSINTGGSGNGAGGALIAASDDGAAMVADHRLGGVFLGGSYDASHDIAYGASIEAYAGATWSSTSTPGYLEIETAPTGAVTRIPRARFSSNGDIKFGTDAVSVAPTTLTTTTTLNGVGWDDSSGFLAIARSGTTTPTQPALHLNRSGSHGDILSIKFGGTQYGSLATEGSVFKIQSDQEYLIFDVNGSTSNRIFFRDDGGSNKHFTPAASGDGVYDLGRASARWKTIYANSIRLGGTTTANELDDYEEGTWTPTYTTNRGLNATGITAVTGRYVKVGETVTCTIGFTSNSTGALALADYFQLSTLPFTPFDNSAVGTILHLGSGYVYQTLGGGIGADLSVVASSVGDVYFVVTSLLGAPTEQDSWQATFTYRTNA